MSRVGRNDPCPCGSGRKAKRCCDIARGPDADRLARAELARMARIHTCGLLALDEAELEDVFGAIKRLPALDLGLTVELPQIISPDVQRLCDAVLDEDLDALEHAIVPVLVRIDTPRQRLCLARRLLAMRDEGVIGRLVAAAALADLDSESRHFLMAALLEAAAVRSGAVCTPGGLLLRQAA